MYGNDHVIKDGWQCEEMIVTAACYSRDALRPLHAAVKNFRDRQCVAAVR
jgi:hypothetical protein